MVEPANLAAENAERFRVVTLPQRLPPLAPRLANSIFFRPRDVPRGRSFISRYVNHATDAKEKGRGGARGRDRQRGRDKAVEGMCQVRDREREKVRGRPVRFAYLADGIIDAT